MQFRSVAGLCLFAWFLITGMVALFGLTFTALPTILGIIALAFAVSFALTSRDHL